MGSRCGKNRNSFYPLGLRVYFYFHFLSRLMIGFHSSSHLSFCGRTVLSFNLGFICFLSLFNHIPISFFEEYFFCILFFISPIFIFIQTFKNMYSTPSLQWDIDFNSSYQTCSYSVEINYNFISILKLLILHCVRIPPQVMRLMCKFYFPPKSTFILWEI